MEVTILCLSSSNSQSERVFIKRKTIREKFLRNLFDLPSGLAHAFSRKLVNHDFIYLGEVSILCVTKLYAIE